jgi:predicted ferric reductase
MHLVLALGSLAGVTWHVLCQTTTQAKIPALLSCVLWVLATIYRFSRLLFCSTGASIKSDPTEDAEVSRIELHCDRPIRVFPGSYFYVFLPGKPFYALPSYPMMVMWYTPQELDARRVKDVTFLVSHHSRPLRSVRFEKDQRLRLDGPYGQDLGLQRFETVTLAAKGVGILGVLSSALSLLEHRKRNNSGPKVNILWCLEETSQEKWVASELVALQDMDPQNVRSHLFLWLVIDVLNTVSGNFRLLVHLSHRREGRFRPRNRQEDEPRLRNLRALDKVYHRSTRSIPAKNDRVWIRKGRCRRQVSLYEGLFVRANFRSVW